MLTHAIILNGPPGVGKDTLAKLFSKYFPEYQHREFKEELYLQTASYFNMNPAYFKNIATDRILKEQIDERLMVDIKGIGKHSLSPRNAMIFLSENLCKPFFSHRFFGDQAVLRCKQDNIDCAIFSDGGFESEIKVLQEAFNRVSIIRLHRDGFDFINDSRDYILSPDAIDITLQDGNPLQAVQDIIEEFELELVP